MKLPDHAQDPLAPFRELRSPVTTSKIRERVLERAAMVPLWHQLKVVAAEALVVGVAATAVLRMSGPILPTHAPQEPLAIKANSSLVATTVPPPNVPIVSRSVSAVLSRSIHIPLTNVSNDQVLSISNVAVSTLAAAIVPMAYVPAKLPVPALLPVVSKGSPPAITWFASISGGAMFSELRILAERGEIGYEDGWKTVALSYTNAYGAADIRGELLHHPGIVTPFLSKEGEQQYSLLFGATIPVGSIELRAMAGPAYFYSSSQNYAPATRTVTAPVTSGGFGVSAEASAMYSFTSSCQAGITGVANYGPSIVNLRQASGLFASFNYSFGQ